MTPPRMDRVDTRHLPPGGFRFAPGVVEPWKAPLRSRVRDVLIALALVFLACAFGAASAWLIAGLL